MKKNILYSLAALFCMAAALVSCSSDDEILNPAETETPAKTRTITVNLVSEAETRTYLDKDAKLKWTPGDEVSFWLFNSSTEAWETSRKAMIDADGRLQVTVGENETKIRVGYPAVEDGTAYDASLFEVKKLQTMDDDDLQGIISNVFSEDENATFLLGKYLPMETSDIDIAQETTVINAPYTVKGAVVKFKLTLPEGVYDYPCIKSVSAGEYKFEFLSTGFGTEGLPFTDQEYKQGEFCVVVPVGEGIDYTPSVEVVDYVYDSENWEYNFDGRYIYTRNETKTSTFTAKAYELNLNLGDAEKYDCAQVSGVHNGHVWIDLGIRKSDYDTSIAAGSAADRRVVFADCNIGADAPEDYGHYFRWGEQLGWVVTAIDLNSNGNENITAAQYDKDGTATNVEFTREIFKTWGLNNNSSISDFQGQTNLTSGTTTYGDAATYNWGGEWKMMNNALIEKLTKTTSSAPGDALNLAWSWTTKNEIIGTELRNKTNGVSIFLPAAGYASGTIRNKKDEICQYWTSTPKTSNAIMILQVENSSSGNIKVYDFATAYRYQGQPVRPIAELPL